ncbi:MAG TPA: aldo/keto reductase [Limnochordia bacterium]
MGTTGVQVPVIGQGTWHMGEDPSQRNQEVEALRLGIELGMTLIDTAEMYADGGAERVVAEAIKDCREQVYLVTKVWPSHADYDGVCRACEGSLKRLGTDWIDLYLLHWPSAKTPVSETMRAMRRLFEEGKIRAIGVSNFSCALLEEAAAALDGAVLQCNQVSYSLANRVIEKGILPYCIEHGIGVMAYSPLSRGALPTPQSPGGRLLAELADKYGMSTAQIALNWIADHENVIAIPKASRLEHVRENAAAVERELEAEDKAAIAAAFPVGDGDFVVRRL